MTDRYLITVDELRAAGALDVPAAWRKSLAVERERAPRQRDLFSGLLEEDTPPEKQPTTLHDAEGHGSEDELP